MGHPFNHENRASVKIISTEARRRASVEWKVTSALCNSSFSGIGINWFCHSRKDTQNDFSFFAYLKESRNLLLSFSLFSISSLFFHLSLFLLAVFKKLFISKRKHFSIFAKFSSFWKNKHVREIIFLH